MVFIHEQGDYDSMKGLMTEEEYISDMISYIEDNLREHQHVSQATFF